jgi:hypothetical protein
LKLLFVLPSETANISNRPVSGSLSTSLAQPNELSLVAELKLKKTMSLSISSSRSEAIVGTLNE